MFPKTKTKWILGKEIEVGSTVCQVLVAGLRVIKPEATGRGEDSSRYP